MMPHVPLHPGDYVVAVILSILGGLQMATSFHVLCPRDRRSFRNSALVGGVAAVLLGVFIVQTHAMDKWFGGYFSFKTPEERFREHFVSFESEVLRNPEIFEAVRGRESSERLQELAFAGLLRLDDAQLMERVRLMNLMLPRLSDHAALALLRLAPSDTADTEITAAMMQLGSDFTAAWMGSVEQAMLAEARQVPLVEVTMEDMGAAYEALTETVGVETATRIANGLGRGASKPELCWAARTLYAVAPTMTAPQGANLVRQIIR
jgi:hypothetical protein